MWLYIGFVKYKRGILIPIRCIKMVNKFWKIIEWCFFKIYTKMRRDNRGVEKTTWWGALISVLIIKCDWGRMRCVQGFSGGKLMERNHLEGLGVNGSIILKRIFSKWDGEAHGLDWSGSGQEQVAGACEYDNEPSSSIKCGEFLDLAQDLSSSLLH